MISRLPERMTLHPVSVRQPSGKKSTERIRMMEAIQLDLFDFAAMQAAVQSKEREVPETVVPRNFQNDGRHGMPTTPAARIEANFKAIRLLKELEAGERVLSHEEQITLSQFSGWGGLTEVFMEGNCHYQALKELLSDEEYQTAQNSILDSYYTPEYIIDFMWDIVRKELGIKSGKVAELGAGTGNFIGLAPMQSGYKFTTVEVDAVAGSIMKRLYPESDIRIASLENVKLASDYDLVIGNVPFGKTGLYDRQYQGWNLHNYFIARALDCLKENGCAVLLTSSATLDSSDEKARTAFAKKAGLVKAIHLPKGTFAGTEVVTDILIFRKGVSQEDFIHLKTVQTVDDTGEIQVNEYFAAHPEHVFGRLSNTGKMYGRVNTPTVLPDETPLRVYFHVSGATSEKDDVPFGNTDLFGNALPEATTPKVEVVSYAERTNIPEEKLPPENCREYSIFSTLDAVYQVIDGMGHRLKDRKGENLTLKETQKVHSFVKIKNALNELIDAQLDFNAPDEEIEDLRIRLRCLYNDHVAKYGVFSNKTVHKYCVEDPEYLKVAAIENCRKATETNKAGIKTTKKVYEPGDILFKRTQWPWREPDHAENIVEAGLISHAYRNCIDLEYIARITGKDYESVKTELLSSGEYFYNPAAQRIELKSRYLSGHIKMKIEEAQAHGLTANVEALKTVLPKPLTIEDIDFALGSFWLPAELVQKWIAKDLNGEAEIHYDEDSDSWKVSSDYRSRQLLNQYNLDKLDTVELIELILNLKDPVIQKSVWNADRKAYVDVIDKEATLTARQYKNEIQNRFHDFVMDDRELALEVEQVYNECFNNYVLQQYDLPTFDVYPGASSVIDGKPFILREHQKRAVTRCIQENTLLAHAVGAGKTAVMITAAMELIRLKLATKTMIVVQNATLQQFAEFAPKLYPTADILVATKNDLVKEKRKRFLGRIATGKWDIVIIAQSSFNMIEDNPDLVRAKYQSELDEMERVQGARNVATQLNRRQKKAEEQRKRSLKKRLDKLEDRHASEDIVYFDQLGVDCIFMDEVHSYKRNFFVTKMTRVKGLDNAASQKAFSLTLKLNQIREKTGGRNIYTATGTPVTNQLPELFNMVRYVSPESLSAFHVDTFDRFASTFTQSETAMELHATGRLKMVSRFCKFTNIVELSKMFRSCADVILPEDLTGIPKPPIKGGHPEQIRLPRTEQVSRFMDYLSDVYTWFEQLDNSKKREFTHIPLLIYGLSRKATIDLRLIAADAKDDPGSKLNVCVNKILEKYREYDSIKAAQVVFSDLFQLKNGKTVYFDVFREIKRKLVAGGIPADEIAIINDYKTDKQRQEVFDMVNSGDVRVIMGSTQKLGTGVNMQERLAVEHDLDAPFRPADAEQRTGRLVRQGNILPEVEVIRYGMSETLDAGMYQILTRKQKFINDALKGKRRNMDEINDTSIDFASFSAQISGNPKLIRKVEVETRLRELQSLEYQFRRSVRRDEDLKSELERAIPRMEKDIERMKELAAYPFPTDFPQIEINGVALEGTSEYRVKQLANHLTNKGIYQAIQHARREREDASIDLGYAKINGIEIELKAVCPFEIYRAREDQAVIRYRLAGESFYNGKIRVGSDVTTGSGLITSLKSVLDAKTKEAVGEAESLELNRQRLKQLAETEGKRVFKYADERIELQKELDKLLFELNELDLLHEDRRIEVMPRLSDYLDLGVEVIAEKVEITDESDEEDAEEELLEKIA